VRRTIQDLLGKSFNPERFQAAYDRLNRPEFHAFTADNQDYLAYICLILGGGLYSLETLVSRVDAAQLTGFTHFIAEVNEQAEELPAGLRPIHDRIYRRVQQGDPTPFKTFRYHEYRTTIERMGRSADGASAATLLQKEIVITQEVRQTALAWANQGALLFGLSDKPDEASVPTEDLVAEGYQSVHRAETHAVGG
jgi:hypothetical protein